MLKFIAAWASAAVILFASAFADDAPLTADSAKRFVESLAAVEALGDELEAQGKTEQLQIAQQPKAGEAFKPYSTAVIALKEKYPSDYAKLRSAVKPHGFGAEEWGAAGDKVMIAYLALKMEEEDPTALQQMKAMDKSMLDMLPPEMKTQFTQAMAMMETVQNASDSDKAAVATVKDDLDDYMENETSASR
ncbi:MAG: hypothetical protein AAFW68_03895 [Pseudomonadota bacterium]